MANVLSPNQVTFEGLNAFKEMDRKRHLEIATPDQPDDHPQVRMIRDRMVGLIHEFDEKGVLDNRNKMPTIITNGAKG